VLYRGEDYSIVGLLAKGTVVSDSGPLQDAFKTEGVSAV